MEVEEALGLNESQTEAVARLVQCSSGVRLVQGPPGARAWVLRPVQTGTGKTHALSALLRASAKLALAPPSEPGPLGYGFRGQGLESRRLWRPCQRSWPGQAIFGMSSRRTSCGWTMRGRGVMQTGAWCARPRTWRFRR